MDVGHGGEPTALRARYDNELRPDPLLAAELELEMTIAESGSVSSATATDNVAGSEGGPVVVTIPFTFTPAP